MNLGLEFSQLVIILLAVTGSAVIKNGVGIGSGIFLVTLLSLTLSSKIALGLGAPAMLISDVVGIKNYWREWNKAELMLLIPSALIGVLLGGIVVKITPNEVFKIWVGAFAVVMSSYSLARGRILRDGVRGLRSSNSVDDRKITGLFGFLGGAASTIIHAGGLIMSIYLLRSQSDKRSFVGTLVVFFAIVNLLKMLTYVGIGILTAEVVLLVLATSPLIISGGIIGNALNKRIDQEQFRSIVLLAILIIGIKLLLG